MRAARLTRFFVPLLLVLPVTAAAWYFDPLFSVAGAMLLYLLAVVWAAFFRGRFESVLTALLSVLAFNYFFLPPRHTFHIADSRSWLALIGLLLVSLTVAGLTARLREQKSRAERRAERSRQAHALAESLSLLSSVDEIGAIGLRAIHASFGMPCALVLQDVEGGPAMIAAVPDGARFDLNAARWSMTNRRPLGPATPDWSELACWCVPLQSPDGAFGAVMMTLDAAILPAPDAEDLGHLETLARQIGLAIQRERAQQARREALHAAESETVRNALLASISHDMRTPLAAIVGAASTLVEQADAVSPQDRARLLQGMLDEARRMTRTAENVLSLARLSASAGRALRTDWESVEEIIGTVVASVRQRDPALPLQVRVEPELPPLHVDSGLLGQLLGNLLDNAARHGGRSPVDMHACRRADVIDIVVRDHGPGLPRGIDPEKLFEPFVRGAKTAAAGYGLGLAICRHIALLHGGTLVAGNHPHGGAEFRLSLPVSAPVNAETPA